MANILLVDDDLVFLDELSDGLRHMGHHVDCAASAADAFLGYRTGSYDIVICDTIMAGGGALSLLMDIRKHDTHFPFVVITGRPEIATSPLFKEGMIEATEKIEKSATVFQIDKLVRRLVPGAKPDAK